MDIVYYKYKHKIFKYLPNWLFRIFHKPIILKNCYPVGIGENCKTTLKNDDPLVINVSFKFDDIDK